MLLGGISLKMKNDTGLLFYSAKTSNKKVDINNSFPAISQNIVRNNWQSFINNLKF